MIYPAVKRLLADTIGTNPWPIKIAHLFEYLTYGENR